MHKKFNGNDSFFIRNEVKKGIKSQIARVCEHKEYPRVHSTISSGKPTQLLHDLTSPSLSQKTQDTYVIQSAEGKDCPSLQYDPDVNVEDNTFIATLNKMALPGWSDNDSNRRTEISKLAETIVSLNCQLHP